MSRRIFWGGMSVAMVMVVVAVTAIIVAVTFHSENQKLHRELNTARAAASLALYLRDFYPEVTAKDDNLQIGLASFMLNGFNDRNLPLEVVTRGNAVEIQLSFELQPYLQTVLCSYADGERVTAGGGCAFLNR